MAQEREIRNNSSRLGGSNDRIQGCCHRIISGHSRNSNRSKDNGISTNIPRTIYIPSNTMSKRLQNSTCGGDSAKRSKVSGLDEGTISDEKWKVDLKNSLGDILRTLKSIDNWKKEVNQSLASIQADVNSIKADVNSIKADVNSIKADVNSTTNFLNPYRDQFFEKFWVKINKLNETWSLMKIYKGDGEKCVGVTSAHVADVFRKGDNSVHYFIQLPEPFYEAGVEAVLLHSRIMNSQVNNQVAGVDLVVVVLKKCPVFEDGSPSMENLEVYPQVTKSYDPAWSEQNVIGRSMRDFVTGRSVVKAKESYEVVTGGSVVKVKESYEFIASAGQAGDSGTLLFATDNEGNKNLVGIYKGAIKEMNKNDRGLVTPAIGWEGLEWKDVVETFPELIDLSCLNRKHNTYVPMRFRVTDNGNGTCKLIDNFGKHLYGTMIRVPEDMNSAFKSSKGFSHDNPDD